MKTLFTKLLGSIAALTALSLPAEAKVFRNAYVSFELPERWDCVLEQTEWVCRPSAADLAQQAIIVLTAKEVGPSDSLSAYTQHLKTPRTIASRTGQPLQSVIFKVETRNIANHPWVDGMHMASEVPNYYTRYLATTKDRIAILVTFSAHKLHYSKFGSDFFRAIESLRVVASSAQSKGGTGGIPGADMLGSNTAGGGYFDGEAMPEEGSQDGSGGGLGSKAKTALAMALILGALGAYLMLKRGNKKNGRR